MPSSKKKILIFCWKLFVGVTSCSPNKQPQEINDFSCGGGFCKTGTSSYLKVAENINFILESHINDDIYKET